MSNYMADLGILGGAAKTVEAINSTSRKNNTTLDMQDFLMLMVAQFQNQSIDDTADTSEMMNQMVQMQAITAMTNMTDATIMSYAGSLVGKEVTIGQLNAEGKLEETVVTITGTGLSNGEQVVFAGDQTYRLSEIMAVGRLPKLEEEDEVGGAEGDKPSDPVTKPEDTTKPENPDNSAKPETPVNPDSPANPETPVNPDNPVNPEAPANPDNPNTGDGESGEKVPETSETQKV